MATIEILVTYSTYAYNALPSPSGSNKTLVAADVQKITDIVRRYFADQFLGIDPNADGATTAAITIS